MVCRAKSCLKDLYGRRGLTNNQMGRNYKKKKILNNGIGQKQ